MMIEYQTPTELRDTPGDWIDPDEVRVVTDPPHLPNDDEEYDSDLDHVR